MDLTSMVALAGTTSTAAGWFITHHLASKAEGNRQVRAHQFGLEHEKLTYQLDFVRQQLDELYGPLALLVVEGEQTFHALAETLGKPDLVDKDVDSFTPEELEVWFFWVETEFFPRHEKMKDLMTHKLHLIADNEIPQTFIQFLDHHNSWKMHHDRWLKKEIPYKWHSTINWPIQFNKEVIATFSALKVYQATLMDQLLIHGCDNHEIVCTLEAQKNAAISLSTTEHLVQFYERDDALINELNQYISLGLHKGEPGIVIASKVHRDELEERLKASGLDLTTASARGQYVTIDAHELLPKLMVDGAPDPQRFAELIGSRVTQLAKGQPHVRAFGELVALLWREGNQQAAIRLEGLWNAWQEKRPVFSLFCAYGKDDLGQSVLDSICEQHSRVLKA